MIDWRKGTIMSEAVVGWEKREAMSTQVTVTLPEEVLRRAQVLADRSGRPLPEILAETIELSLQPLGPLSESEGRPAKWSDEEVLAAAEEELLPEDDRRLSELLERQQAGVLTNAEHSALVALMEVYQQGLLRKSQALREAVRRGLQEPLSP